MRGTWQTEGGSVPVGPVLALAAAVALAAWLATVLLILAAILAVVIIAVVVLLVLARRYNQRETAKFEARQVIRHAAIAAEAAKQQVNAQSPAMVINNYGGSHLYLTPGAGTGQIPAVLPVRDAITEED